MHVQPDCNKTWSHCKYLVSYLLVNVNQLLNNTVISQRFGLTTSPPGTAPLFRWLTEAVYRPDYWLWSHNNVWNDGKLVTIPFNIQESDGTTLKVGQTLGMAVFPNGELCVCRWQRHGNTVEESTN